MGGTARVIDYLDMSVSLTGINQSPFRGWLKLFLDEQPHVEGRPKIKNGVLSINSTDFISFMGYVNPDQLSELELKRLETVASRELSRLLFNSIALDHQYHYKWCLAALKNLRVGRKRKRKLPKPIQLKPRIKTFTPKDKPPKKKKGDSTGSKTKS